MGGATATPPIVVIESFTTTQAATDTAVTAIADAGIPSWADEATRNLIGYTWGPARQHIITGKPMGGHPPPDSTINGSTVMLFEYRQGPVNDYPYAFWRNGEFKGTIIEALDSDGGNRRTRKPASVPANWCREPGPRKTKYR